MPGDTKTPNVEQLKPVARQTLNAFERIVDAATAALQVRPIRGTSALANIQTLTSANAISEIERAIQQARAANYSLVHQPAIARVVVVDEAGDRGIIYVTRTATPSGVSVDGRCASSRSPIGRVASLPIGGELRVGDKWYSVLERARLRPEKISDEWDSKDTIFEAERYTPITVESLRRLLAEAADDDLLGQLLSEESEAANIFAGIRRGVIMKMTLRDQPTLDEFQDEIFRLPLDRRLLIVGPAGTGKTTTLVRRLGQKLDTEHLEGELRIIEKINSASRIGHGANWVMFSPTQLLKQFLKEAFAIERIPAPDLCVRTWGDYRRELGRETLGVLRTVGGGGSFVLKETISTILPNAVTNAGTWFADFDAWQRRRFFEDLSQSAKLLTEHNDGAAASFGHMMATLLAKVGDTSNVSILVSVAEQSEAAQGMLDRLKAETDAEISSKLNLELNRNRSLVDELMDFMDSLRQADSGEDTETDDQELDEDDDDAIPPTRRGSAINAYRRAVRAQARAAATRRALNRKTRTGRIAEWLGERTLPVARRLEVGNSLQLQRLLRRFTNPVSRYVDVVPRRYRAFRRERQHEGRWYVKDGFTSTDLHPLELDLILLSQLQAARSLLERSNVRPESTKWISLKKYADLLRTQVLVDEATDFSPVQLACMFALTNPQLSSFFACGDFNQRLTVWGTRSAEDLQWIFRDLEIRKLRVVYRQSRQLNELAMAIVQAAGGVADDVALPAHVDSEGFPPALLESTEARRLVPWLATRILEIENFVGKLPSIAIFVPSEHDVTPIARELNDALLDHNIQVTPCVEGQIIGDEHNVRVFDAQHIKGLEFEAVFFVGIDRLAETYPELLEKYLYVGATRAATYLGLTCETRPPDIIVSLRHLFTHDWSSV